MKVLVIGGTGFIGLNVVRALQSAGHDVHCTRRASSNTLFLRKFKPKWVHADVNDFDSLRSGMLGMDAVVMAAGHYPRYSVGLSEQIRVGVQGVDHVMRAAREAAVPKVIYTSSITTCQVAPQNSVYCRVKAAMEACVLSYLRAGQGGTVLCPSACFGPFDVRLGTGSLLVGALLGKLPYYVDGMFNIVDVMDVARAHVAAVEKQDLQLKYRLVHLDLSVSDFLRTVLDRYSGSPRSIGTGSLESQRALGEFSNPIAKITAKMPRKIPMLLAYPLTYLVEHKHARSKTRSTLPLEFLDMLRTGSGRPWSVGSDLSKSEELCSMNATLEDTLDSAVSWFRQYKYL